MLPNNDTDWTPCERGTLASTIAKVRSKRRQTTLVRLGASTVAFALVTVIVSFYTSPNSSTLDCHGVGGLLTGYVAGDLDQESRELVEQHMAICEKCRIKLRRMQSDKMATQTALLSHDQLIQFVSHVDDAEFVNKLN